MPRYTVSITRSIVSYVAVPSVTVYLGAALTANGFHISVRRHLGLMSREGIGTLFGRSEEGTGEG